MTLPRWWVVVQLLSVRAPGKTTTDSLLSQTGYKKPIYLILSLQLHPANDDSPFSKEHFFTRIWDLWNGWNGPFIWFLARLINARVIAIAHSKYSRVTWLTAESNRQPANPRQECHNIMCILYILIQYDTCMCMYCAYILYYCMIVYLRTMRCVKVLLDFGASGLSHMCTRPKCPF